MNTIEKKKSISSEEDQQALRIRLKEALLLVEKIPRYKRFPNKYKASVKRDISEDLIVLYNNNTNVPLKEVIIYALKDLDADLPDALLLEMTQFALQEWKNIAAEALQENSEMQLA